MEDSILRNASSLWQFHPHANLVGLTVSGKVAAQSSFLPRFSCFDKSISLTNKSFLDLVSTVRSPCLHFGRPSLKLSSQLLVETAPRLVWGPLTIQSPFKLQRPLDKNGQFRAVQGLFNMQETSKEGLSGRAQSGYPIWRSICSS
jgi:hypothetical protein